MNKSISKKVCKQYGVSDIVANIVFANLTADTVAYWILTGKIERPAQSATSKGYWLNKLMASNHKTWNNDTEGSYRKVFLFSEHGMAIKVDVKEVRKNRLNDPGMLDHFHQNIIEAQTWESASIALKSKLCPVLACFVGKHGRKHTTGLSGDTTIGRYAISIMPLCDTNWRFHGFNLSDVDSLRGFMKANGIKDVHHKNIGVLKGELVALDYGIR